MDLKNKVAIVTGSSKGLGLAVVQQLLEAGCIVHGWSRSATPVEHENFHGNSVDVGNEEAVQAAFQQVIAQHKTVDILINNAGFGHYGPVEELDSAVLKTMFDTNVLGIFYLTKCAVPVMRKAGSGHIINIASIAGLQGIANMAAYNGTKFAVKGMSESLFKELRPHGIKVTCILPGSISTNFFDELEGFSASNTMMNPADVADSILYCLKSANSFHPVNVELRPFVKG